MSYGIVCEDSWLENYSSIENFMWNISGRRTQLLESVKREEKSFICKI